MSLTVYGAPLSPFVRKVRLFLAEKGLDYQLEIILPFGQPAWYQALNPLGRIPAMKDDDFSLADSSVICQYLEDKHPELSPLLGRTAEQRARVRWLEKYADYELAPLSTFTVFRNRALKPSMGQPCDESAVQTALTEKLPPHFDYLENTLGNAEYFVGDSLTLADLAFASQMVNMEHGDEQLDAQRWPNLAGLYQRMKARPALQAILPGEQKTLAKMNAKP
ncbi:glutathione S-transferase family protein [Pseudomonas sp. UBA2684]|uniref:glutathione S-transferase family protein n=1 Tax=Pseudomonas sp. UBA2684 TaxID=1947311 RepID=UPI0025EBAEF7|nr:glutathione S-transferase family protein [Pseudomonas sp. UBA2684]|tara:strand:+ start:1045 stop:1707 length:663 start_codon:yes stop_codon:yes gene_type:complete